MKSKIYPAIWFDNTARHAFDYYASLFHEVSIMDSNPVTVAAKVLGTDFIGINGGPAFRPNPAISFMIVRETQAEIEKIWNGLAAEGHTLMPLDSYPWSPYYGWLSDRYDVSWQLYQGKLADVNEQSIVPTLMFCGPQQGRCAEATSFYERIFKNFVKQGVLTYPDGDVKGQVMHTQFVLEGYTIAAMDSGVPQPFTFTEGVSLVIECDDQSEIDYYWHSLTKDGEESRCGWCKDPYGVSWQIVPKNLGGILQANPRASEALMQMQKIIMEDLKK
ncbi:MAG TPA: VOC family protein [Sphingobacterium sp.]|jgi:predicted 3-demethylubiquinone-9 3-methyltransferase (glyoxalase superfamily)|nr:VOC family protein [Sphingobacterium sp.]